MTADHTSDSSQTRKRWFAPWHWLVLLVLLAGLLIAALLSDSSAVLLLGLAGVVVIVVLGEAGITPRKLPQAVRSGVEHHWARLRAIRQDESRRRTLTAITGLLALLCFLLATDAFLPQESMQWVDDGIIWMFLGSILVGFGALIQPPAAPTLTNTALVGNPPNVPLTLLGIGALLLVAELSGNLSNTVIVDDVSTHIQFVIFCVGLLGIGIGLSGVQFSIDSLQAWARHHWREIALLLPLLVVALVVRVVALDTLIRVSIDEALAVQSIVNYWWDPDAGIAAAPSGYISSYVYPYLQSHIVALSEPTLITARVLSAIVGTVGVLAVYLLGRELIDRRTAWLAALVLLAFPPHLHFSRSTLSHIVDATLGTLALWLVLRALRYNRRGDWVLGGVLLGMTQYFFEAGRLFFPLFVLAWLLLAGLRAPHRMAQRLRGVVLLVIAALMVGLPIYYAIYANEGENVARFNDSGMQSDYWLGLLDDGLTRDDIDEIAWRFTLPFHGYVRLPSGALFYGGETPLILTPLVPLFLAGFFWLLWRLNPLWLMLPLWIVLVPLSNGLLREVLVFARFVVVFPAVALVIAVGLAQFLPALLPTRHRLVTIALPVLLAIGAAGLQVGYYFTQHAPTVTAQHLADKASPDTLDTALRAADLPQDTSVYVISDPLADGNVMRSWLTFLRRNENSVRLEITLPQEVGNTFFAEVSPGNNIAFFITRDDAETLALLRDHYGTALGEAQYSAAGLPNDETFVLYYVDYDDCTVCPRLIGRD